MNDIYFSLSQYTIDANLKQFLQKLSYQQVVLQYKQQFSGCFIPPLFILPSLLSGISYGNFRLTDVPKNNKPRSNDGDILLPQVDPIATGYATSYVSVQFSLRFIKYLLNPVNHLKILVADNPYSQEALTYYKSDQLNLTQLENLISCEETKYRQQLKQVTFTIPNGKFTQNLTPKQIDDVISFVKTDVDKNYLDKFFQKGKLEILRQTGLKESNPLDDMKTSPVGYNLIRKFEKFVPKVYSNDGGGGGGNCTIGYGHLIHEGPCTSADFAKYGNGISQSEAEAILKTDVEIREDMIRRNVTIILTQNQFDALASFLFTMGEARFKSSTLLKKLNTRDFGAVPTEMKKFIYSNNKLAPGLIPRREEETQLFNSN